MVQSRFRFFILSLFSAFLAFQLSTHTASSQTALKRAQILEDAKATENLLKKYHPNLYVHRTPKQINRLWNEARSEVPENPDFLDAATVAQKILAAVCDEHTTIKLNKSWLFGRGHISNFLPTGFVIADGKLYLDNAMFNFKLRHVVSINGRSSDEIMTFLRSITSADGCQNANILFSHHVDDHLNVSILLSHFLGSTPVFEYKYREIATGAIKSSGLPAISLSKLQKKTRYRSIEGRQPLLKSLGIDVNPRDWEFALDIASQTLVRSNSDQSIYYVYLPSFSGKKPQSKAIDDQIRALVKAAPRHVIIDLTDNPGGQYSNAQQFLSYFLKTSNRIGATMRSRVTRAVTDRNYVWQRKNGEKNYTKFVRQFRKVRKRRGQHQLNWTPRSFGNSSYKGDLTVLVSPKTGSAATSVATILKRKAGAKVAGYVGDISMKTSCSGAPGQHTLSHSKVAVRIPLDCYDRHPTARRKGDLLRPDIPVDISQQNSRMTNVLILSKAVEALNLKDLAGAAKPGQSARNAASPQSARRLDFLPSNRTIQLTLAEHPTRKGRSWLGISMTNVSEIDIGAPEFGNEPAVLITKVFQDSPAEKSGLKAGDILLLIHGSKIQDTDDAIETLSRRRPGARISIRTVRLANSVFELTSILSSRLKNPKDRKFAALVLGSLYASGDYGHKERHDSIRLFEMASDSGSADAAAMLGHYYSGNKKRAPYTRGLLVARDSNKAMDFYARAAALGDGNIMFELAELYDRRDGVASRIRFFDEKRVAPDPELSAKYLLHAYQKRHKKARDTLFDAPYRHWSVAVRVAVKKHLHDLGLFKGTLDAQIGQDSRDAIVRLRKEPIELPKLPSKLPQ